MCLSVSLSSFILFCVSLFFFFIIPPPPSSTLFPYTTLFRSGAGGCPTVGAGIISPTGVQTDGSATNSAPDDHFTASPDRKSTRLNSSHGSISYAVFCLKKKTKTENTTISKQNQKSSYTSHHS